MIFHPPFCTLRHDLDEHPDDVHLSWPVQGAASAGGTSHRVSVAAAQMADGGPAVQLVVACLEVSLTLEEARALSVALEEMAEKACWR